MYSLTASNNCEIGHRLICLYPIILGNIKHVIQEEHKHSLTFIGFHLNIYSQPGTKLILYDILEQIFTLSYRGCLIQLPSVLVPK